MPELAARATKTAPRTAPKPRRAPQRPPSPEEIDGALDTLETPGQEWKEPVVDEDGTEIPADLQFTTTDRAPREITDDDFLALTVDGQELGAWRPDEAMWTILLASLSSAATTADRAQAILQFVDHTLDDESKLYVRHRLMDRGDAFDVEILAKIVEKLIQKWTPPTNRAQRRAARRR